MILNIFKYPGFLISEPCVFFMMHPWSWGVISPSWIPTAAVRMPVYISRNVIVWRARRDFPITNQSQNSQMYSYLYYLLMYLGILRDFWNTSKLYVNLFVDVCFLFLLKSFLVSRKNVSFGIGSLSNSLEVFEYWPRYQSSINLRNPVGCWVSTGMKGCIPYPLNCTSFISIAFQYVFGSNASLVSKAPVFF